MLQELAPCLQFVSRLPGFTGLVPPPALNKKIDSIIILSHVLSKLNLNLIFTKLNLIRIMTGIIFLVKHFLTFKF